MIIPFIGGANVEHVIAAWFKVEGHIIIRAIQLWKHITFIPVQMGDNPSNDPVVEEPSPPQRLIEFPSRK